MCYGLNSENKVKTNTFTNYMDNDTYEKEDIYTEDTLGQTTPVKINKSEYKAVEKRQISVQC